MKVEKKGNDLVLVIPRELAGRFSEGEEVATFELSPTMVLLVKRGALDELAARFTAPAAPARPAAPSFSDEEIELLRKLESFKFEERIPYNVHKGLGEKERKLLESLVKRGVVTVFKGGKYAKTGVYNIPSQYYSLVKKEGAAPATPGPTRGETGIAHLEKYGYVVIESEGEAKQLSLSLEKRIKSGEIMGTRGFDKTFYVATRTFYNELAEKVRALLRAGDKSIDELSWKLGVRNDMARVALELMNQEGEVIEKKKGVYSLID